MLHRTFLQIIGTSGARGTRLTIRNDLEVLNLTDKSALSQTKWKCIFV